MTVPHGLLDLARRTKRYGIWERQPGQFEVIDERYLLDCLLQLSELRPTTNDLLQIEFEEALEALSSGPTLTLDDTALLGWLTTTVEVLDPDGENRAFNGAYAAAAIFGGTHDKVERFLLAALDQRVL